MNHQYESEILFHLMERDGFNIPSSVPPYESEIKAYLINQVKLAYPKLTDYEAEWLLYNYTKHLPADFPISSATNVTEATFENVVPFAYQSAILKGSTKYRDIDTGEILETFEEGRNLELVSVKMAVLTTTGKNLFDGGLVKNKYYNGSVGELVAGNNNLASVNPTRVNPNTDIVLSTSVKLPNNSHYICEYASDGTFIKRTNSSKITTSETTYFIKFHFAYDTKNESPNVQLEEGSTATSYEPYKSNILTVNEDVTLRSNGDIYDELNLLTGQLTQRIDENNEVLAQEVVKTVDLKTVNESGESIYFMPLEGTMHVQSSGEIIQPTFDMSVPVEATTQNLNSFIDLEMEE